MVSFSADAILENTKKIKFLREMKVETWDLTFMTPIGKSFYRKLPVKAAFNRSMNWLRKNGIRFWRLLLNKS